MSPDRPDDHSPRRQHLVGRPQACGPRVALEAFLEVAAGTPEDLDPILESFCEIPPEVYRAIGADVLPIDRLRVVEGGRT
jgi:hypothetical protein